MVADGSEGVFTNENYILNKLPYAKGLQFEQLWWIKHKRKTFTPGTQGEIVGSIIK